LVIADVLAWSKQYPQDWKKVWHLLEDKWDKRDPCPDGALRPFNIDAKLNGAYIALGAALWRRRLHENVGRGHAQRSGFGLQSGVGGRDSGRDAGL
jgi:hypothetical protein